MPQITRKNLAIVGLGLLGTSLAMALRDNENYHILGWTRRKDVRDELLGAEVIQATDDKLQNVITQADITVLCLPVPNIIECCKKNAGYFKKGSLVTDVGSVKNIIVEIVVPVLKNVGVEFIGSHPMAGTEDSGPEAAFPELYEGATILLTRNEGASEKAKQELTALWQDVGGNVMQLALSDHDRLVAETSHLSHILAWLMVEAGLNAESDEDRRMKSLICASGFRDVTRIASSSPAMWRQIIENNHDEVVNAMKKFEDDFHYLQHLIHIKSYKKLQDFFSSGKKLRDKWLNQRYGK